MTKKELYLKTIFSCMACDGDIAKEEVKLVKQLVSGHDSYVDVNHVQNLINQWIALINEDGVSFLKTYLNELSEQEWSIDEQLHLIDLAIRTIEADECIEYAEVKFFKKIRARLSVSDDEILKRHPDKEDFLLPDINVTEEPVWKPIQLNTVELNLKI